MGHAIGINQLKTQGTALRGRGCVTAARSSSSWESKSYKTRESLCGGWKGGLLEGCLWAFEAAFCLPTDHKYVGEELILGEAEGKLCLRMPSVWGDPEVLGNIYNRTLQCRQKCKLSIFNISVSRRQTLHVASFDLSGWYHLSLRTESNKDCNHWLLRGRAHWCTQVKHPAVIEGWRVGLGMFPPLALRKHSIILCSRKSGLRQQADRSSATDVVST